MPRLLLATGLLIAFAQVGWTDVIVMRDGRRIEGKVLRRDGARLIVLVEKATLKAEISVEAADVVAIEKQSQTSYEALLERFREQEAVAAKSDDAGGWEVLAQWSKDHGLEEQVAPAIARALAHRVIAAEARGGPASWSALAAWCASWRRADDALKFHLRALAEDPEHAPSRVALGHRQLDGHWLEPAAWAAANAEKMRLAGYVEVDGAWHTAEAARAIAALRDQSLKREVEALRAAVDQMAALQRQQAADVARFLADAAAAQQQQAAELARLNALLAEGNRERDLLWRELRAGRCRCVAK